MNRIQYSTGGNITLAIDCVVSPAANGRILSWVGASHLKVNAELFLRLGDQIVIVDTDTQIGWDNLDTGVAEAGKDYFVYACLPAVTGDPPVFKISLNATYPSGYDADTSRKIGGFHTLCLAAGTISGHPLTGYATKAILPYSVWDLKWRPASSDPRGLVYSTKLNRWGDIYLMSGTGLNSASAFGAAFTVSRDWNSFVDDLAALGKRLMWDWEFQVFAEGSNEETNISDSASPGTTGGHVDTAGRRMLSNIGCEDCCGVVWQWLLDQSYQNDATYSSTWAYCDLPGAKGSLYRQGATGDVKLRAGGLWADGSNCGSRARKASCCRWSADSAFGGRGCTEHLRLA